MKNILISLLMMLSLSAHAETDGWITRDGKRIPNSDTMKSVNGFGGSLVITADPDWERKWNTPPEATPVFSQAKFASYGEKLAILAFYTNPKLTASGDLHILCNIKLTGPDGSAALNISDVECATGKLRGNPRAVRLVSSIINFIGEDGDLPGKWTVEVTLIDKVRGTAVPLKAHFILQEKDKQRIGSDAKKNAAPVM